MTLPAQLLPALLREEAIQNARTSSPVSYSLPKPYHEWQRTLMHSTAPVIVAACGTKIGKTLAGSVRISHFSYKARPEQAGMFRIIAPTYNQSGITFRYLERLFPEKIPFQAILDPSQQRLAQDVWDKFIPRRTSSKRMMQWRHNGSIIQCLHGQDPEKTIEGEATLGNIIDEAAKCHADVFASVVSTTTQTGGWITAYSTPMGKNHFYKLWCKAKDRMDWCNSKGIPADMIAMQLPTSLSPYVKPEVITMAKETLPSRLFNQLYLAEFEDDGSVFVGVKQCIDYSQPEIIAEGQVQMWTKTGSEDCDVVLGIDWARKVDFTVVTAWNAHTREMIGFMRTNGTMYKDIIKNLFYFGRKFRSVQLVRHDKTGIGDVIDELLSQLGWAIEGIVLTNQSKAELVNKMIMAIQHNQPRLPNWPEMIRELESYEVTTNKIGLMIFNAPDGQHDDIVVSMFLGWSAVTDMVGEFEVKFLDALPKSSIERLYDSLSDDEDDELFY